MTSPTVEKPATAEELARLLHEAASQQLAVVPRGGGRASEMGNPLDRQDVVLQTTRLDRVLEHSQADMVVSVEAGITVEALQDHLGRSSQFLPLDALNSPGHTVGGLLASGWTGPLRLRYGSPRDFLIGIRVALPDGKLAAGGGRVVKNVSGYDMMKLHYGALGSLGVIVAASFKVFPKPLHDVTVSSDGGWDDVEKALSLPLPPSALELFAEGRVVARFLGSPAAVSLVTDELGWSATDSGFWAQHSTQMRQVRIVTPREKLRSVVDGLTGWWASPGAGIAYWTPPDASSAEAVRRQAEAAGGSLVTLTAAGIDAWGTPPATLEIQKRLKDAFDPGHVLNPGRFVV
ncbi:MAG TPA: FAD-binding oxidoreductase [Candidatus Dormibacteraeota bacterium]|nr:FAD-binding oxidoreductase [Candidatus Dormibacteraeota bacterium]